MKNNNYCKTKAIQLVNQFLARTGTGHFKNISRKNLGNNLIARINSPGKIDQGSSSLCAPAALLYSVAKTNPEQYSTFAIELFEKGRSSIQKLVIEPSSDLKLYSLSGSAVDPADWITLASIRDSNNWFFDYQSENDQAAGITLPGALEKWFKKAGYTKITNETNVFFNKNV